MNGLEAFLKLIAGYSGPVIILLGIPIYFVKRYYDWKTKKAEAKNSVFQQQKLTAIIAFIASYTAYERINWDIIFYQVLDYTVKLDEVDNLIDPLKNKLTESLYVLHLFLNKEELSQFKAIYDNALQIDNPIKSLMFDGAEENRISLTNIFQLHRDKIIDENSKKLSSIGKKYRSA